MKHFATAFLGFVLMSSYAKAANLPLCPAASVGPEPLVAVGDPASPRFLRANPEFLPVPLPGEEAILNVFGKQLNSENIRMVVISIPPSDFVYGSTDIYGSTYNSAPQIALYQKIGKDFRLAGIEFIDIMAIAKQVEASGQPFFALRDHHWSAAGIQATAAAVRDAIDATPVDIQRDAVTTLSPREGYLNGSYDNLIRAACGKQPYPDEQRTFFDLGINSNESLLGDASTDTIVLGDSFGINYFGFPQVLSDALKTPVVSAAQNGGGSVGGFTYGLMTLAPATKPRLIVYAANNITTNSLDIREYSATLDTVLHPITTGSTTPEKAGSKPLEFDFQPTSVSTIPEYLQVILSGPRAENVPITLTYTDGRSENRVFHRNQPDPAENYKNVFSFALPAETSLKFVTVDAPLGAMVSVSVQSFKYF